MRFEEKISRADKAERRREELLQVSLRLFSENGFDATSIRDIAKEAGVTEGLIYHYFRGKKDLLKAIVEGSCSSQGLFQEMNTVECLPLDQALSRIGARLLQTLRSRKEIFRLMLAEARLFEKDNDCFFPKLIYENNMVHFGELLRKRMERGELREMEPVILARQFTGSLVAFFLFQEILLGQIIHDVSFDQFLKSLIDIFINGVKRSSCEERPFPG